MDKLIYRKESYAIIGALFEVYNNLGSGFSEIVYKDALEYEFKQLNISFERENNIMLIIKKLRLNIIFMLIL